MRIYIGLSKGSISTSGMKKWIWNTLKNEHGIWRWVRCKRKRVVRNLKMTELWSLESINWENKYKRKKKREREKCRATGAQPEKWCRAWISAPQHPLPTNTWCPSAQHLAIILEREDAEGHFKFLVNVHLMTNERR